MEAGSKVVVLPLPISTDRKAKYSWLPKDDGKTIYRVRDFCKSRDNSLVVTLEEGIIIRDGVEKGIEITYIREVDNISNLTIDALLEELEEKQLVHV